MIKLNRLPLNLKSFNGCLSNKRVYSCITFRIWEQFPQFKNVALYPLDNIE